LVDHRGWFRQLTRRGDEARDRGAYARAARFYRRALALDPCRADIRVQLGNMLKELARHQQAEAAYRRALSQSPEDGDIHLQLAHLLKLTGRKQEAIAAYRDAHRLLADSSIPAAEIMALGVEGSALTQLPPEEACEAHIREGDRLRDARDYAGAAEAYGAAVALAPARTDIRVQHGNMLKDAGRLREAEAAYRAALAQAPRDADIHLQLGHTLKLQGRRTAALECYRRAAELAPFLVPPQRELFSAGERANQEDLFDAQLRLGGVEALMEMTHRLLELRTALDRIAEALPDIQAQLAFPVASYDRFRELYGVPDPPPISDSRSFAILLMADLEELETLRAQMTAVTGQTHQDWILRVVGTDPARRRAVEQIAAADPRIAWIKADDGEGVAVAERRVALACESTWLLLLTAGALLHPSALAWFCAAAERGTASAFVADEEVVTRTHGRARYSAPQFRQVVDYDTLLEMNPFGDTIAVTRGAYRATADRLATQSIAAARSSLLLSLAHAGQVGHIPCALVARDGERRAEPKRVGEAHRDAVRAHLAAIGGERRIAIGPSSGANGRLTIRWRPSVPDMSMTVIIPTRDNGTDVQRFIQSLRARASVPEALRLLVIDNGSRQAETCRILVELATRRTARVLTLDEPFSWSHLNNRAVDEVDTPLIVFANDDMVMLSEGWDNILRGLLDRPEIGAVGAGLLYPDETIQHAGILFGWQGGTIHDGLYESRWEPGPAGRWHVTRTVAAVTGAFMATRRELFLTHGGFDDAGLPVSYSDIDYALKLRASGLKVLWTPEITAYHHESKSRGLDYLDPEKRARASAERAVMEERWGAAMATDPGVNPVWHMATLPFRLLSAPSQSRLWTHIALCATRNPWLPEIVRGRD
jgi:tetratricopeptide (TPR) repeat protein/GT2 family glycosyltransferase